MKKETQKRSEKMTFPASKIQAIGIKVTTVCKLGGVGLGYILPAECIKPGHEENVKNIAWQSGGNGFYYPKEFAEIKKDGGRGYVAAVCGIGLGHYFEAR